MKKKILLLLLLVLFGIGGSGLRAEIADFGDDSYQTLAGDPSADDNLTTVGQSYNGSGTESDPYLIGSLEDLTLLRDEVNGGADYSGIYFKLTASITITDEWTPIGVGTRDGKIYTGNSFKGTFDGDNNTISGLKISSTTDKNASVGLFGVVDGGTVKNLVLTDVDINVTNSNLAGAAIGMMLNGATADNITVSGTIIGNDGVGGIVGRLIIDGTISNCINNASVTSAYGGIGGIVGKPYYEDGANTSTFASITNCTNNGTVTAPMYIGGIAGLARANVTGCTNNGEVKGGTQTGGIIGQLIAAGTVSGNENKAKVSGKNHLGGIIGDYSQSNDYTYYNVSIANNINRGELDATEQCAAIMGCNNIDGFTAMTATGNVSYYYVERLELFGNPEDMVIDETNEFIIEAADFATFKTAVEAGINVKLTADITTTAAITTSGVTSVVDLNGKTLIIGAGENQFNDESNITIKNGVINITGVTVVGNAIFRLDEYEKTLVTTMTLENVNLVGDGYSSAYGIFYIGSSSVLNVIGGEWNLKNDTHTSGGVFKADDSAATLNIEGTKITAHNVRRFVTYAATEIDDATIALSGDAEEVDAEMEHGFNRSPLTISNSTITMKDMVGRGITTEKGAVTIENSSVTMTNVQEATIDVRGNQTVTIDSESTVVLDKEPTVTTGTITGNVTVDAGVGKVAKVGDTYYKSLQEAIDAADETNNVVTLISNVQLEKYVTISKSITLDLGAYNVNRGEGTALYVDGENINVTINGTTGTVIGNQAVFVNNGTVTINGGNFVAATTEAVAVYVINNGKAVIEGGTFSVKEGSANYLLNEYDATREVTDIKVYGGQFKGFNPQNNAAEGAGTNFCAEGYAALLNFDDMYVVGVAPTATVNNLGAMTIEAGNYDVYDGSSLKEGTTEMPLSFVMQFTADQNAEDMEKSPFADWYGDFVLTFTGIENGSFATDGCYLAGHYREFGWIKIPAEAILNEIKDGERYPVMLGVGMGQKYEYICSSVEEFKCALYLTDEVVAANPNINVTLELSVVDDSKGESKAANALAATNSPYIYKVNDHTYVAKDFTKNIAVVGNKGYATLPEAVAAAQADETVTLLDNATGAGVVIDKDVTIDFGGFTYSFNEGVGSGSLTSNGFQILKNNNVTLKNGTLNVNQDDASEFYTIIQNYANLTVENMKLDGTNLDKWSTVDGESIVLSINSGTVNITGATSITANDEGDKAFAFDVYDYTSANYPAPTVTVNTEGTIKGIVEVSATLNIEKIGTNAIDYIAIEGAGQLFHNGLSTTVKKHIEGTTENGWYTISSPVGTVGHDKVEGLLNGTHDLYYYNEEESMWENVKDTEDNTFNTLNNGQGYLYANAADTDLSFKGELNTNAVTIELTSTEGNLAGFNLIGNPFTHNISKANLTGVELGEGYYVLSNHGEWQAVIEGVIAPMQGVLVQAATGGELSIYPEVLRSERVNNGSIAINVANANYSDVAYVSFNEGIGLNKISHRNENVPMVYVPMNGENFAIATMSQDVAEIPVSFKAATMGSYTISVEAQDCEFANMTLIDRMTGIETNLLLEDYTFVATSNDNTDRFVITLGGGMQTTDNSHFTFINNGELIINNIEGEAVIRIIDALGRFVAEYNATESVNIPTASFRSGVYMIQMYNNNNVKVQKIVIE